MLDRGQVGLTAARKVDRGQESGPRSRKWAAAKKTDRGQGKRPRSSRVKHDRLVEKSARKIVYGIVVTYT